MFIPRSVERKPTTTKSRTRTHKTSEQSLLLLAKESKKKKNSANDEQNDEVVRYSKNQRWPAPDEPSCVVCGKYGAYICDKTDQDVCSLECKEKHVENQNFNLSVSIVSESVEECEGRDACGDGTTTWGDDTGVGREGEGCEAGGCGGDGLVVSYLYREHDEVGCRSEEEIERLRKALDMRVHGVDIPKPITEFTHCNFNATLTSNVQAVGYNIPTPIQMQVLPAALRHRDIIACAQTGSGKTAAFLLPIIASLCGGGRVGYNPCLPKAIVLAPTRELCMQIEDQAKQLMKGIPMMKTALIVGGLPMPPQIHRLQQGIQLVIATPGRLIDIIDKYVFDFSAIKCFVLDEVDTMLQMGFESQVRQITSLLPQTKQTLMFSATIPEATEKLAETMLKNPVLIAVGKPSSPSSGLKHTVLWVEEKSKKKQLFSLLSDPTYFKPPVVVFVDSKVGADLLTDALCTKCGIAAVAIHGDKSQEERSEALKSVQECRCDAIVATGLLGRGLDLVHVTQVIHFDMPSTIEEFIHQTGRAGRLGSHGSSITFINNTNKNLFLDIVTTLCPLSAVLPSQLLNSPHLIQQKTKQKRKRIVTEDTQGDRHKSQKGDVVTSDNLMQLLRDSKWRRRHRKSRIL